MEFLRPLFHDELDAEGDVQILTSTFQRHDILFGLEKVSYDQAFSEWLTDRRFDFLDRSAEIIRRYDQADLFDSLLRIYKGGRLVPFVGAGLSVPCGYPGWTDFLWRMWTKSGVNGDHLRELLGFGEYEKAAQALSDDLGPVAFNARLKATFEKTPEVAGVVQYLPYLFKEHVVTTNFDRVLEGVFADIDQGFDNVVLGRALGETPRMVAEGGRLLIKIHGSCQQLSERVVLQSEYDKAYADDGNVRHFFNGFLFARPLLFLGCSLAQDRTIREMKRVVAEVGEDRLPTHFAILEQRPGNNLIQRERELAEAKIFPIWYPTGQHECIEAFLANFIEEP